MDSNVCPECGKRIYRDDFQCASCGLLLHPEQATGEYVLTDPSIVRALLSPNQPRSETEDFLAPGEFIDEVVTAAYPLPMLGDTCPQLVGGMTAAQKPLHPYEAHVASFIDGDTTVPDLARVSKVPLAEVRAVISSLFLRGLVELDRKKPKSKLSAGPVGPIAKSAATTKKTIEEVPTDKRAKSKAHAPARKFSDAIAGLSSGAPAKGPADSLGVLVQKPSPGKPAVGLPERTVEAKRRGAPPPEPAPGSRGRAAVAKALAEARQRTPDAPLQERAAVVLDSPEEFLQRAISLERQGQVDGAIYVLKRAIERVKQPGPLYNKLALILLNQRKDYREAETLLRQALKAEPSNSVYQQNLYQVLALAAASGTGKHAVGGLWSRIRGK